MFVGSNYDKINVDDICDDEDYYTTVTQPGSKYFFIVVVDSHVNGDESLNTVMVDTVSRLLVIMNASYHSIREVHLVTPAHMNHSAGIEMERLSKISIGYEPEKIEQEAYIFQVMRKKDYVDSTRGTPAIYLCNISPICSFKMAWDK
jgi:hypothetical protein